MNNMNDNRSYSGLVEKYIGTAYDKVALVADNIELIIHAADHVLTHHNLLLDRHEIDSHPQEAITGLVQDLLELNIKIGSAVSSIELGEVWAAVHLKADASALQAIITEVATKADIDSVNSKAEQADLESLEVMVQGKASAQEVASLAAVVVNKADKTELVPIFTALANKVDLLYFNDHADLTSIHTPVNELVLQTTKGQPFGVAPLDGAGHISAAYIPAIPHISHVYPLISDMMTAAAVPGTIKEGQLCFVYGEGRPATLADAPEGKDAAAWLAATPRLISDKNGEYIAKKNDPQDVDADFYFYGDWVPSHSHTPSEIGAAPETLVDRFEAHTSPLNLNAHKVHAQFVAVSEVPHGSGSINIGSSVQEALGNLYNAGMSLLAQLGAESLRISDNQHRVSLAESLANQNKADITNHIKAINPHGVNWSNLPGAPTTFPPSPHTHTAYEPKNSSIMAHVTARGGNPHQIHFEDILGTPPGGVVEYDDLNGIPSTFTPKAHTQPWSTITTKPAAFPPKDHTHASNNIAVEAVSGLRGELDALDTKANTRFSSGAVLPPAAGYKEGDVFFVVAA